MGSGFFGQPGANGGNGYMQHPFAQPYSFAGQTPPYLQPQLTQNPFQQNPFQQNQFQQSPFNQNPYQQSQLPANPFAANQHLASAGLVGSHHLAQHIVQTLGQIAQQNFVQSALTQQIGTTIQQLVQIIQSLQAQQSLSAGQGLGLGGAFAGGLGNQAFGNQAFGPGPQAQAWGANRQPTIQ